MEEIIFPCVECNNDILYIIPGYPHVAECIKCGHPNDTPTTNQIKDYSHTLKLKNKMIKIEFEGATGAEIRNEMMALLGLSGVSAPKLTKEEVDEKVNEFATVVKEAYEDQQRLEASRTEEQPKPRTRRSKAEIEAAKNAETWQEQPLDHPQVDAEPTVEDQGTPVAITADDLTKKAVELGRAGHRDKVLAVLENDFGGATISKKDGKPTLTPDQYEAVMEAFNAIG